jgi:predicted SAM-dependent methyltransferase
VDLLWRPGVNFIWNLRWRMPFRANSCSFIYHEHYIEHISPREATRFLRDCHRVLAPGGVMRIATPSLKHITQKYLSDWHDQDWLSWSEYQHIQTGSEMMNIVFRWWGHKWIYDEEELERRLRDAGFTHIKFVERNVSTHAELCDIESRKDSILVCEATKE